MEERKYNLTKQERLNSKLMIERLFSGGNKSFPAFPIRVVYISVLPEEANSNASILISVPKKRFKRAVKRNLVKRQIREAYRLNKHILTDTLSENGKNLVMAFLWLDNKVHESSEIEDKMKKILLHIKENME